MADPRHIQLLESDLRSAVVAIRSRMPLNQDKQVIDKFLPLICRSMTLADHEPLLPTMRNLRPDHKHTIIYRTIRDSILGLWQYYGTGTAPKYLETAIQLLTSLGLHGWDKYVITGTLAKGYRLVKDLK